MERRHFELERGYLNIDADGLAFTRSGNWQHAREAPERSRQQRPRQDMGRILGYLLILSGGLFSGLMKVGHAAVSVPLTIGLIGLGAFKLYRALRHDLAPEFRIPFPLISELQVADGRLTVHFLNGDMEEDQHSVIAPPEATSMARNALAASRNR